MSKEHIYVANSSAFIQTQLQNIEVMGKFTNRTFSSCSKRLDPSAWGACKRCVSIRYSRKRAEAEGRKGSFPCSKAMSSHHPTDPVELRRINFQTPGTQDAPVHARTGTNIMCSLMCGLQSISCTYKINVVLFPFPAYRVSVYRGYRRLSS